MLLFPIVLISCNSYNINYDSTHQLSLYPPIADYSFANRGEYLIKYNQTKSEIEEEDKKLIEKYKNIYNPKIAMVQEDFSYGETSKEANKVLIFLDGDRSFFEVRSKEVMY